MAARHQIDQARARLLDALDQLTYTPIPGGEPDRNQSRAYDQISVMASDVVDAANTLATATYHYTDEGSELA